MGFRGSMAVTFCVVAAGLTVAGCSGSGGSGTGASGTATGAAGTPTATPGRAAGATTGAGGSPGRCQASDLRFSLGAGSGGSGNQKTQAIDMTNMGSAPCTMAGFPGVNLVGSAKGKPDYTWPLARQSASYDVVTVPAGGAAHFVMTYLVANPGAGPNIDVGHLVITPPNDYSHGTLNWFINITLQDGATHPGTYISPVKPGA